MIITLLTDFTTADGYVAAMKGVMLGMAPGVHLVDVSHSVPPQDVHAAAYALGTIVPYFPPDTVHVTVVDPGVGSDRRAVLLETPLGRFLGPDNGVLTYVLLGAGVQVPSGPVPPHAVPIPLPTGLSAFSIENRDLFLGWVSNTFHGRDIFAPVAARLAAGLEPPAVGPRVDSLRALTVPLPARLPDGRVLGRVIHVDAFGNLITNLTESHLPANGYRITTGGKPITGLSSSYRAGGDLLAIVGSSGRIEIAARDRSAWAVLGLGRWSEVAVLPD